MKRTIAKTTLVIVFATVFVLGIVSNAQAGEDGKEGSRPVTMTWSGTNVSNSQIILLPGFPTGESTEAGHSSLGAFNHQELSAGGPPSGTCGGPNLIYFPSMAGAGVYRFQDGSLLTTKIEQGSVCVDVTIPQGHVTVTYQITGGTGRFKNASGTLMMAATAAPVLFDAMDSPVFYTASGETTGTIVLSNTE